MRHKEDSVYVPKSLFDRPLPLLMKMRRELKLYKYRTIMRLPTPGVKILPSHTKATGEPEQPMDWMINEDWLLLQAIQVYQAQSANSLISPGCIPNWDLISDVVNNGSRLFRSPKQCKVRYDFAVEPREEGKLLYDNAPKKQKKQKGNMYKTSQVTEVNEGTNNSQNC